MGTLASRSHVQTKDDRSSLILKNKKQFLILESLQSYPNKCVFSELREGVHLKTKIQTSSSLRQVVSLHLLTQQAYHN